jgi:hypothetical protein
MSTRSLTKIYDDGAVVACIYRQMDGYPSGHGTDLARIIAKGPLVNGLSGGGHCFNGMGCFAAQVVASLKDGPGSIYLYPTNAKDCGEEYLYKIRAVNGAIIASVFEVGATTRKIFEGGAEAFAKFCKAE